MGPVVGKPRLLTRDMYEPLLLDVFRGYMTMWVTCGSLNRLLTTHVSCFYGHPCLFLTNHYSPCPPHFPIHLFFLAAAVVMLCYKSISKREVERERRIKTNKDCFHPWVTTSRSLHLSCSIASCLMLIQELSWTHTLFVSVKDFLKKPDLPYGPLDPHSNTHTCAHTSDHVCCALQMCLLHLSET